MAPHRTRVRRRGLGWPGVLCALLAVVFLAGEAQGQEPYSQQKLETFAQTVVKVQEIAERWLPRISKAKTDAEARQLNELARAEVTAAIEATPGITVAEYLEINQRATTDPLLADRINDILRQMIRQ